MRFALTVSYVVLCFYYTSACCRRRLLAGFQDWNWPQWAMVLPKKEFMAGGAVRSLFIAMFFDSMLTHADSPPTSEESLRQLCRAEFVSSDRSAGTVASPATALWPAKLYPSPAPGCSHEQSRHPCFAHARQLRSSSDRSFWRARCNRTVRLLAVTPRIDAASLGDTPSRSTF